MSAAGRPRPFLKWAGGKTQLLGPLLAHVDRLSPFGAYHEPFLGGGALYFELVASGRLGGAARLSDANPALVTVYEVVRDDVEALIVRLREHAARHDEAHYYAVRAEAPSERVEQAARFIYLNKTCFNGLYRENAAGRFNVPIGRYTNPAICDEPVLRAASAALRGAVVAHRGFAAVLDVARPGDLVYFDPPYVPLSATASFTRYARDDFGDTDQVALAAVFRALAARGVKVLLSNSMTPRVRELYAGFSVDTVLASRAVNSRGGGRGAVEEALVWSGG